MSRVLEGVAAMQLHQALSGVTRQSTNGMLLSAPIEEWQMPRKVNPLELLVPIKVQKDSVAFKYIKVSENQAKCVGVSTVDLEDWLVLPIAPIGETSLGAPRFHLEHGILYYGGVSDLEVNGVDYLGRPVPLLRSVWLSLPAFPTNFKGVKNLQYKKDRVYDDKVFSFDRFLITDVRATSGDVFSASEWLNLPLAQ